MEFNRKNINWYRFASVWYQFGKTMTLYHGTNDSNLVSIFREGVHPANAEQIINESIQRCGYTIDQIPDWIWKGEMNSRAPTQDIYLTTLREQAISYAKSATYGGEIATQIIKLLKQWAKTQGAEPHVSESKPIVLTIELPWEKIRNWQSVRERLLEARENMTKLVQDGHFSGSTIQKELNDIQWEIKVGEPIDKEYIVAWEAVM